ncbi:hypothetical protein SAMN05216266_11846 [Amycolatopsis marina]|uniref:Uncharacterized protein n=1 Tax=Amycolatopsis marina TaxID=490629 RepID=A0A1I1C225_9PSEU|nr:hypothetical protein [Amycolatopsis marina]SFB54583.1 hypothetical protein SAMN05216266_11846 [Amycolatopsis marina]
MPPAAARGTVVTRSEVAQRQDSALGPVVTFAVGLFDLFTYTIPGALYLSAFAYLAGRLHWIDLGALGGGPLVLLVIGIVLASYLLGYLAYPLGARAERLLPRWRSRNPRQEFLRRNPAARHRTFVKADAFLLYSALQAHDKEVAVDVTRLRTAGLMLRNSSPPMALGFVASAVELALGRNILFAAGCPRSEGKPTGAAPRRRRTTWVGTHRQRSCPRPCKGVVVFQGSVQACV